MIGRTAFLAKRWDRWGYLMTFRLILEIYIREAPTNSFENYSTIL